MADQAFYKKKIEQIKDKNLYREAKVYSYLEGQTCSHKNEKLINFSSNSYLGLHHHHDMKQNSALASEQGTSATASRLVSGTLDLHHQLEDAVKKWKGASAAMLFNSGFQANCGIIQALADKNTIVFTDRLVHASIIDGVRLSGAAMQRFKHNDMFSLRKLLEKFTDASKKIIISETIFSMDGDESPVGDLVSIAKKYNAFLYLDDAHGAGVYGKNGRGPAAQYENEIDLLLGTFSKALGSFGAYAVMSSDLKEYLVNTCRSYIFSTALPPSVVSANLKSIELMHTREINELRNKLLKRCSYIRDVLKSKSYELIDATGPIIAIIIGDEAEALQKAANLKSKGFLVPAIRPPTVPVGTSRLRLTVSALHSEEQIHALLEAFD